MSVQFGRCNFDGQSVDSQYVEQVKAIIASYGPDGVSSYLEPNVTIQFAALHTTKESRLDRQPKITPRGDVVTWDGRLDNRLQVALDLNQISADSSDAALVAAAWEKWGIESFARFIGDWTISIWRPGTRSLVLAKDPIGTRHLFYSVAGAQVAWSTILEPLILQGKREFRLNEEYIAGWLSAFPATHLTPWVGIEGVRPSHYVHFGPAKKSEAKYWDFNPRNTIRYSSDSQYDDHFRYIFTEAVHRRLRSDGIVVAELSGGVDSSSIVCVADKLIAGGMPDSCGLTTISYHCSSEPSWDEYPYFTRIEELRGRKGWHVDVGDTDSSRFDFCNSGFSNTPASQLPNRNLAKQFSDCMNSQQSRILLSGVGGDEVTGGVPTPTLELEDLLAQANFIELAHKLKRWALEKRKPWFQLLLSAIRPFCPAVYGNASTSGPANWLNRSFAKRHRSALSGYWFRRKLFGPRPSFQENLSTLELLRRQLSCTPPITAPPCERRYPYLDRDLLEFLYAIPREQLVRPGQRRSLMRRALVGIVPDEVLNRKRKAYVARWPLVEISNAWRDLDHMRKHMLSGALGIIDQEAFADSLQAAKSGNQVAIVPLMRALLLESWLTGLDNCGTFESAALHPRTSVGPRSVFSSSVRRHLRLLGKQIQSERR